MPLLDAYIPEGALEPEAERRLLARCTDLLLEHEGADPANEAAQQIAWVFVHRPDPFVPTWGQGWGTVSASGSGR
jgi:phenylpyruvate tautomerase PptA (4-oxalocrotonate tautomerase family)